MSLMWNWKHKKRLDLERKAAKCIWPIDHVGPHCANRAGMWLGNVLYIQLSSCFSEPESVPLLNTKRFMIPSYFLSVKDSTVQIKVCVSFLGSLSERNGALCLGSIKFPATSRGMETVSIGGQAVNGSLAFPPSWAAAPGWKSNQINKPDLTRI